ncbi:MAG: acyl carrier protein phosphodiesterase, partial [Cyclobacteriaceae bacterium]|nr:acyl carrier protein phosphodiesterase [Cyclobacteriaceae bacterium]
MLAKNWDQYHATPLDLYTQQTYQTILSFEPILPEHVKYMLQHMIPGNWLLNYAHVEGIHRALSGMARRSKYESKMELAVNDLQKNYDSFTKEFEIFFPDLQQHADSWLKQSIE